MGRRWLPTDKTRPAISDAMQTQLVDTLYAHSRSILLGCIGSLTSSLFWYCRGDKSWALGWAIGSILITGFRLWLAQAYRRRPLGDDPMVWANWFAVGGALNSALWGAASGLVVFQPDPFLQMVVISAQAAYVSGSALHNSAVERAAMVQITLPIACLVVACLLTGDPYLMAYGGLSFVGLVAAAQITRALNRTFVDLLFAEHRAAAAVHDLAQVNARLESLAATDGLTGVLNRRGFDMALGQESARALRDHESVSLLLIDLDHFKALNDRFGHQAGDACLVKLAHCLLNLAKRPGDVVARYGGEEFAVLLADTDYAAAGTVAERLRAAVISLAIPHPVNPSGVTISIGYATSGPDLVIDEATLIRYADLALYRAKSFGRNRAIGSQSVEPRQALIAYLSSA